MKLAIAFTNFGPYHLARLHALGESLAQDGHHLVAHEVAGSERKYPWELSRSAVPYERQTLFPDQTLEDLSVTDCRKAMIAALNHDRPDAVAICGYARPESLAALSWAERHGKPAILMSESQRIDRPRIWWKEAVKKRRVQRFTAALVGGPSHRDYLVDLGMPASRVALGYNAVDNRVYATAASRFRQEASRPEGLPAQPYFLAVSRFVDEKNLPALIRAYAAYRSDRKSWSWPLVLCGGGTGEEALRREVASTGLTPHVHFTGFLRGEALMQVYAHAGAFILPSLSEPWGLVANEAAACGLPLLLSNRAGCSSTLVPEQATSGFVFAPTDEASITAVLSQMSVLSASQRRSMGNFAAAIVANWGPSRFAHGMRQALGMTQSVTISSPESSSVKRHSTLKRTG